MDKASTTTKTPSCWSRRTKLERSLITLIALTAITILFLVGNLIVELRHGQKQTAGDICLTEECIHTAADILEKIDFNVNPCEDFYKFSCGNFIKKTHIPDEEVSVSSFSTVSDKLDLQLRQIVEKPIKPSDSKSLQLVKTLYKTCMNTTKIERNGLREIKKIFKETGGWPLLEDRVWNENSFDWKKLIYRFKKIGIRSASFFSVYVGVDQMNSTKYTITINQPCMRFQKQLSTNGLNDSLIQYYYDFMVDIAVIFGADKREALKETREIIEFEINLAKLITPWEKRRNSTMEYNPMTIKELQHQFSTIPWLQYINVMLSPNERVDADDVVIVTIPEYFAKLGDLLSKTTKRAQANYLYWKVASNLIRFLPEQLRNRLLKFEKIAYGKVENQPRWKKCLGNVEHLNVAAAAIYIRNFFKNHHKYDVVELITDIKTAFIETVKKTSWMDTQTKKHALEKAQRITSHVGYPNELLDDKIIDEYYENLELSTDDYLQSYFNISLFYIAQSIEKLRQPVNKTDWRTHAYSNIVNAFYDTAENSIDLPAGILHESFFNTKIPQYMNYGNIGYIIGHEITHGFDDTGRQYDKNGNLVDWWQPTTHEQFKRKAQCIIDQYSNYTVPELNLNLNGVLSQGENIADNGGIKIAYAGYRKWMERNEPEPMLPGLPYNPKQMFWIAAATKWCRKYRPEALKQFILSGFHSPSYFRVVIPFMNSKNFGKDFNCQLGTPMNPKYKCGVW